MADVTVDPQIPVITAVAITFAEHDLAQPDRLIKGEDQKFMDKPVKLRGVVPKIARAQTGYGVARDIYGGRATTERIIATGGDCQTDPVSRGCIGWSGGTAPEQIKGRRLAYSVFMASVRMIR